MNHARPHSSSAGLRPSLRGFTLIELLVVIGIIGIMVGVLVGVLGGGNSSTALQSAQGTMSSLLASARAQAALTGQVAAVLVDANKNNPDRYLRYCVVATLNAPDITPKAGSTWTPVNEGYTLPTGVYILPNALPTGAQVQTGVNFSTVVANGNAIGFDGTTTAQAINSPATAADQWFALAINPLGQRVPATGSALPAAGYIILSTGDAQPPGSAEPVIFNNARNIRGLSISQYGVAGLINDPSGFQ